MWLILGWGVISVGVLLYGAGFIMRTVDSPWLAAHMDNLFPLLTHKFPAKTSQLLQLGAWALILPAIGYGILRHSEWCLFALLILAAWEVYLGATFYFEINDVKQACVHMITHAFIAGIIVSHLLRRWW